MNPPPINPDTPRKPSGRQHLDLDLDAARAAVVADLGDIPQVSVEFFIKSALPNVPKSEVQRVRKRLRQTKTGVLHYFPDAPKDVEGAEPKVFAPMKDLFDAIVTCLSSGSKQPRLKFVHSPGSTPGSERANSTRPDAVLELLLAMSCKNLPSDSAWSDIPLVIEEKKVKDASTILDNDHKIIWAGQHMLSNDPCRRFAFGITIENEQMKLWLFSRSHVMVSEPFNWRQDPSTLIQVFGGLAFASDVELGYDPTMTRFLDPKTGKIRYTIEVAGKVYVTKKVLTDHKSDPIRGRATRVWETSLEGDTSGETVALKDIWLDSDAELEGDLQKRLIELLEALPQRPRDEGNQDDEQRKMFTENPNYPEEAYAIKNPAQYFLTVVDHGLVKIDGVVDDTKVMMMRGNDVPSNKIYRAMPLPARAVRATISGSDRKRSVGGTPGAYEKDDTPIPKLEPKVEVKRFQPKKHYRIVFLEVGMPLHDLTSLKDIFKALSDVTRAIHCLYLLGYVHRDISTGNILFYLGIGKLCDLEFAKHVETDSSHEIKTGTPDFIAVEIQDRQYRFMVRNGVQWIGKSKEPPPVLRYNTLHDLESTWWIAVWMLLFKYPSTNPLPTRHANVEESFFPSERNSSGHRERILAIDGYFVEKLHYLPENLQFLRGLLEKGRTILVGHYSEAEKKRPVVVDEWWRVHEYMGGIFEEVMEQCTEVDKLRTPDINGKKRPVESLGRIALIDEPSIDADPPRKRQNTGSMAPPSLPKSVRSQSSTKTSSQKGGGHKPPQSSAGPAYRTRSHNRPSGNKSKSTRG